MSDRCERIRDRLPELAAGRLESGAAAALREHIETCVSCAAEFDLVRLLCEEVAVPADLEARVRAALHRVKSDRAGRWASPARLAMAASVILALVTASVVLQPGPETIAAPDPGLAASGSQDVDVLEAPPWPAADEPLLSGGPALYQLSTEELEILLEELGS